MPGPVSRTENVSESSRAATSIATSPLSVNLIALPTRLRRACASRRSSPRAGGRPGGTMRRNGQLLFRGERLDRAINSAHQFVDRIVAERKR